MIPRTVKAGDVVIRQGESGDKFYVIDHGTFCVYKLDAAGIVSTSDPLDFDPTFGSRLLTLENEGTFGELALMWVKTSEERHLCSAF